MMSENIFSLRFGFDNRNKEADRIDREELLARMLSSRLKRIRIVERLIKISHERKRVLNVWGLHSDLMDARKVAGLSQDVVILLQEKNLLSELQGDEDFIQVGEIRRLDWPIRFRERNGPMDSKDYYS
eukprot:CAMPEP_0170473794 /NCGR_PEP_ID=MMETSP0123-20130129/15644_1 /TAXON_ID=182087 /ORGANISM="Favella ehrenbergii, Strain Fehren 1" /LENGTH=127 /DNA_ID=CAMNT_0010743059 /DNA_START=242 /DNA_END=625 /DNA_ORIENTATION=+